MRKVTRYDVDEAWLEWVAVDMTYSSPASVVGDGISPTSALRMITHARFCSLFCEQVLQNEPDRIVEITRLDIIRAVSGREREIQEWVEDWEILPASQAKEHYRQHLAQSQRDRIELICLRHLWLASQARRPSSVR
jgi:hypothetical protein